MHSMDYPPPSIKRPEVGLSLRSRDQLLLPLRARYLELLEALGASPATAYVRGIIRQIDAQIEATGAAS